MGGKSVGVISAMAAVSGLGVQAAPANASSVPVAQSYAELLEPIPNAVERLRMADAEAAARPAVLVEAQYDTPPNVHHHHHHHHHHQYVRRHWRHRFVRHYHYHHHHHHHHHQSNY